MRLIRLKGYYQKSHLKFKGPLAEGVTVEVKGHEYTSKNISDNVESIYDEVLCYAQDNKVKIKCLGRAYHEAFYDLSPYHASQGVGGQKKDMMKKK